MNREYVLIMAGDLWRWGAILVLVVWTWYLVNLYRRARKALIEEAKQVTELVAVFVEERDKIVSIRRRLEAYAKAKLGEEDET